MKYRTSFSVLYFVAGFFLAAVLTMILLVVLRPYLGFEDSELSRYWATFAPLIIGIPYGLRVSFVGMKEDLKLATALKRAASVRGLFL